MIGPSGETLVWAAKQVLRQHTEPPDESRATGRCGQCGEDCCALLAWATSTLDRLALVSAAHG